MTDSNRTATASRNTATAANRTAGISNRTETIPRWAMIARPPAARTRTAVIRTRTTTLRHPPAPPHDALRSAAVSAVRNCACRAPETRSVNSSTSILPISAEEPWAGARQPDGGTQSGLPG